MGNCFASDKTTISLVHPLEPSADGLEDLLGPRRSRWSRVRVRMTTREYMEIVASAGPRNHEEVVGRIIVEGCLSGRWRAQLTAGDRPGATMLVPIAEEL